MKCDCDDIYILNGIVLYMIIYTKFEIGFNTDNWFVDNCFVQATARFLWYMSKEQKTQHNNVQTGRLMNEIVDPSYLFEN